MKIPQILKLIWERKPTGFWKKSGSRKALVFLAYFAILIFVYFDRFNLQQTMLSPDEVATRTIQSKVNAVIIDEQKTEELLRQAEAKVQKSYQEDKNALINAQNDVKSFYQNVEAIINSTEPGREKQMQELLKQLDSNDSDYMIKIDELSRYLLNTSLEDRQRMQELTLFLMELAMDKPITEEALGQVKSDFAQQVKSAGFAVQAAEIIRMLGENYIRANLIYDQEATEKARAEARQQVEPVQKTIKAGEIIVREGERVTAEQISILEQLGMQRPKNYPVTMAGLIAFLVITTLLGLKFLKKYYHDLYKNDRLLFLIALIIAIILLIARFLMAIKIGDRPEINLLTGYLAPVAAGSMLIAILLDGRLGYFVTMLMALYVGLLSDGNQLYYAIVAFVGGAVGVYRVSKFSQNSDLAKSGLYIASVNIVIIITLSLLDSSASVHVSLMGAAMGAIKGILSAVLMIGALPYLETAFSITSMMKLLELSNPNNPLLKQLLLEAPGTYHHSLMVANLAEATAEYIGANPLLVRVGAYYHDIGKMKRPEYYVENQRGGENPHEKIAPALSALIITSHIREGVEMAKAEHLPMDIIDFITQHHGTSLTKYFYDQARQEDGEGNTNEENYRYEGPRPQTKEVALVMLADSVEAAVRSLPEPKLDKINEMVHNIIREKLNDGQLDECDLTFKDLDVIAEKFCEILEGIYHRRIEYPDSIARELSQRRKSSGNSNN